jgi:hypothetical protein
MKELMKTTLGKIDLVGVWPSVALVLFTLVMVGVFFWIMRPGTREYYEQITRDVVKGD